MLDSEAKQLVAGDLVIYMPTREEGLVTKVSERFVFVRFDIAAERGTACYPRDLVRG